MFNLLTNAHGRYSTKQFALFIKNENKFHKSFSFGVNCVDPVNYFAQYEKKNYMLCFGTWCLGTQCLGRSAS